jgi:predicted AlkP superfamily pyrophosphatase or phosphodiesterase
VADAGPNARLGVVIVVDQLRGDLLPRYDDLFTGGFRRILDGGAVFTNTTHDHAETATAPGHTTLATGRMPRNHGIAGNSWYEEVGDRWRPVYAVSDTTVRILADPGLPGRSPRNIRAEGIGDWIRAADPDARVVAISRKDRGAIPLAGHGATEVYWLALEDGVGGFTTSTYYHEQLPEWVREANATLSPELWGDTVWTFSGPAGSASRARPDANAGEGDGVHTTLPHHAHIEVDMYDRSAWGGWLKDAPPADGAVTALAIQALGALDLGAREAVDLLALSYSATDGVGHTFGPLSTEQLDNLLRLDRELGELMDSLDASVGAGRWTLALSADHGVVDLPEWAREQGMPARRVTAAELEAADPALAEVTVDDSGEAVAAALRATPFVEEAYPFSELRSEEPADSFATLFRNSFVEGRPSSFPGLNVAVRLPEGANKRRFGTGHGTPYYYDRWVPFIVYGAGVTSGIHEERAATVDLAPTLARLLGITPPADLDGTARLR